MNSKSIIFILLSLAIILLFVYFFIIKRFLEFINGHRSKIDHYIELIQEKSDEEKSE